MPSGTTTLGGNSAPGGKTMPFLSGQQAKGRPFLYLTPHALHKVLGPNGPHLHCGVSHDPQFKQIVALPCFLTALKTNIGINMTFSHSGPINQYHTLAVYIPLVVFFEPPEASP
jgi:hypothetical protein